MKSFWNNTTLLILCCTIGLPILNIYINYCYGVEGFGIANSITLLAVFITILSTFYSNYKSDERVDKQIKSSQNQFEQQLRQNEENLKEQLLFDKKQKIYIKLYKDLNDYWELLDMERVTYYLENRDYEPILYITFNDFSQIHEIMRNFKDSPDFLYMPQNIQEITNKFLRYVDNILDHYQYYKIEDSENYHDAIAILSEIFPILKQEIGMK